MEIRKIRLNNVGRFTDLEVAFAPTEKHASKVTVFVGNNGAGKTTILNSLVTSLSWLVARIRTDNGSGSPIPEDLISNGASSASIDVFACATGHPTENKFEGFCWTLARTRKGHPTKANSDLADVTKLADFYRLHIGLVDERASVPIIAFYPVERTVLNIPLNIRKSGKASGQMAGYDYSLSGRVAFGHFFEWFREREDSENEQGLPFSVIENLAKTVPPAQKHILSELTAVYLASRDTQLSAVRGAIKAFMPDFDHLRVQRQPYLHMAVDKAGKTLNVSQLSQGEKTLMALIGDIARRLAIMNPSLKDPLLGKGVVLIDEVDLHLHPQWQRRLIHQLTETFPNCQFILTTHSPLVISDTKDVLCYVLDDGELEERNGLYGLDANQVLLSVMDTDARNSEVQDRLDRLLDLLQDKKLKEAKALFEQLSADLPPGHIELTKAALLIRKLELRSA